MPLWREWKQLQDNPQPAYPEYGEVRAAARAMGDLVSPHEITVMDSVPSRRGADWCTAVLGKPFPGLHGISISEARMLVIADERNLNPPLAPVIVKWRAEDAERERQQQAQRDARDRADREKSATALDALANAGIRAVVRASIHTQIRRGRRDNLAHITPEHDVLSGRSRRHRAGRALCESPSRAIPLPLSEPEDAPATCVRCLAWVPKVRPAPSAQTAPQ